MPFKTVLVSEIIHLELAVHIVILKNINIKANLREWK